MAQKITSPFGGYYIYPDDPGNIFQSLFGSQKAPHAEKSSELTPAVDIFEDESAFHASIEMPGVDKNEIRVSCSGGNVTINADVARSSHEEGHWIQHERRTGTYVRSIAFRDQIQTDQISASYEDGILRLTIPKKSDKHKSISISVD